MSTVTIAVDLAKSVTAGRVPANAVCCRDLIIRAPLREEPRDLHLARRQAKGPRDDIVLCAVLVPAEVALADHQGGSTLVHGDRSAAAAAHAQHGVHTVVVCVAR